LSTTLFPEGFAILYPIPPNAYPYPHSLPNPSANGGNLGWQPSLNALNPNQPWTLENRSLQTGTDKNPAALSLMSPKNVLTILPDQPTPHEMFLSNSPKIIAPKSEQPLYKRVWKSVMQTPNLMYRGLMGANDFGFGDKMAMTNIPYILGGAFLILGFAAGRNKVETIRQGVAVAMYFAGVGLSRKLIEGLYHAKYGVNLNLKYKTPDGKVEKVFATPDFPRFDLLREEDYERFARGFKIPQNLNDPYGAINERLKAVIVQSQALKIIIGNLAGVFGAAFFARTTSWTRSAEKIRTLSGLIRDPRLRFGQKLDLLAKTISSIALDPLLSCIKPRTLTPGQRRIMYGSLLFMAYGVYRALQINRERKNTSKTDPYSVDWQFAEALKQGQAWGGKSR
jgi:hypothetical protein